MTQEILVVIAIFGAVFFLGRKMYIRFFKRATKCDGCAINKSSNQSQWPPEIS